jgi:hypothetical protein
MAQRGGPRGGHPTHHAGDFPGTVARGSFRETVFCLEGVAAQILQAFAATRRWPKTVERMAEKAANRIHRAWQIYCNDFDSGAVGRAVSQIKRQ